jgi:hypothetical protein
MSASDPAELDRDILVAQFEKLMEEKNYAEARSVLEALLEKDPQDRVCQLYYLLDCIKLRGVAPVEEQIEKLRALADLTDKEREILRQIFLASFGEAEKQGDETKARMYEEWMRKLVQGLPLGEPAPMAPVTSNAPSEEKNSTVASVPPQAGSSNPSPAGARATGGPFAFLKQPCVRWTVSGLALVFLTFVAIGELAKNYGNKDPRKKEAAEATAAAKKPKRPFLSSPALDSVVLGPKELGLQLSGLGGDDEEQKARFGRSVENQLMSLRQLYRQEVQKNPELMGAMLLQMTIDSSGAVTQVQETASRIQDKEFKNAVVEEARKWNLAELSGPAKIECPLLFVPAGMDMTTLIKWEKAQGLFKQGSQGQQAASVHAAPSIPAPDRAPVVTKALPDSKSKSKATATYRVRTTTSLRKEPRFSASPVEKLEPGTQVKVLAFRGDWLEVESKSGGSAGFIRKEYASLMDRPEKK